MFNPGWQINRRSGPKVSQSINQLLPSVITNKGGQAKDQLTTVVIAQFGEYSRRTTTRDIAAQAGQNIAVIIHYPGSKGDLYLAHIQRIAGFIGNNFHPQAGATEALLTGKSPSRQTVHALILNVCHNMILLLTQDGTVSLSRFISREQLAPIAACHLIRRQVTAPPHHYLARLTAVQTGYDAGGTQMILYTHALPGEMLAFRLGRKTVLLRTSWAQFDA